MSEESPQGQGREREEERNHRTGERQKGRIEGIAERVGVVLRGESMDEVDERRDLYLTKIPLVILYNRNYTFSKSLYIDKMMN